jgi:hypothetical protein
VPAVATKGSPEYRGWWVYVPTGYDPSKPYRVIYSAAGCFDPDWFHAGADGYPYQNVDNGAAILVGLDYDTYAELPADYDSRDPASNDLLFMPWLMNEIENTFCVDRTAEWMSQYESCGPALAQQLDCTLPARLRGTVLVGGCEPGNSVVASLGTLPTCNPAPMAAFFVHDLLDTDDPYACILPGCSRILAQNGCSNTSCDPMDPTLTTPYSVTAVAGTPPQGVDLFVANATCVQFRGCPAEYPVVFCTTNYTPNHAADGQAFGVVKLFWDFISRMSPASPGCPPGLVLQNGTCGPCPAGETDCGAVCLNEQTDPNNCGSCGKVCAGGCQGGVCN